MTSKHIGQRLVVALVALCMALAGCTLAGCNKGDGAASSSAASSSAASSSAKSSSAASSSGKIGSDTIGSDKGDSSGRTKIKWKAKKPDGSVVVSIKYDGSKVSISYGSNTITAKTKGNKRKYMMAGALVAAAKGDGERFKLKNKDGELLWKVKLADNKIKVSNNEDGNDAYVVKSRPAGFKVKRNDDELGKVNFYGDKKKIKVKGASGDALFKANADKSSALWAVLLMTDIPEAERYIVMAELGARGR